MLGKHHRLNLRDRNNRDLLRGGKRVSFLGIQGIYDFSGDIPRAAVIIPKSIVAKATRRNELRRQIFNNLPEMFESMAGLRLILRVQSPTLLITPELMSSILGHIHDDENRDV